MKTNGSPKLHFGRLKEVNYARRELFAEVPAGTKLETIQEPSYWAHYTSEIRPMDLIEVFCEDASWEASFRVMFVSAVDVKMKLRWHVEYDRDEIAEMAEAAVAEAPKRESYAVKWKGPAKKFTIIRTSDNAEVASKLHPKSEAIARLRQYEQELER